MHKRALARVVLSIACAVLSGCGAHHAAPRTPPVNERVAISAKLNLEPLDLSPDGAARLLVRLQYFDAAGGRVHIPPGGHVDVFATRGDVQWQPRARFGDPAAIVRLTEAGPLLLRVTSDLPRLPRVLHAATDTRAWRLPAVTARALGPHVVVIGWFPRIVSGVIRIARISRAGVRREVGVVSAPASTLRDTSVSPGAQYTYEVRRPRADPIDVGVDLPHELPASGVTAMRGKGMWLSFDDVSHWNVDRMLDRAETAGIRTIQLRLTYGEYDQVTPARQPTIDRFIDGAAKRGIAVVGWTVPRAVTFEDLAAAFGVAAYRTRAGHGITGLAVDLERGADFLSAPSAGLAPNAGSGAVLADYIDRLREAVGPRVLLVATVEDPYLERLTAEEVPYAAIAAAANVMQPMTYWRMRAAGTSTTGMQAELAASYRMLQVLMGSRTVPVNVGGQTANLGNRYGAPPAAEVGASFAAVRELGAIGETLFDWDATTAHQWNAIAGAPWPL